ncbi:class I SAM-dependent methyltransferase [Streptomonospora wellingtoniae]|uniref:Class I SAM-dependent methyltransferase n=1 Tax=Streptomonospora wellingtoniae TaxID=3075544 RepID=A0ABU2L152_9ACTN|nr:class I SAM-dependent methyltransferase [Streptomonospora sp. DSM 45055]MDT0304988.1 class I SAM-dependent methyltransferase [Streptomonospora sp. DSM 45055]
MVDGGGNRWSDLTGGEAGERYAARFAALADSGADVHGEAHFCAERLGPGSRVLDAGCGTGRVAIRLAELGHCCTGVDADASMLAQARRRAPAMTWREADLVDVAELGLEPGFDMALAAGNVVPLLAPGTEPAVVSALASLLRPGGLLVAGFGLDADHLPLDEATVTSARYDAWCADAGLEPVSRHSTWDGDAYTGGGYAVSVHRRP